MSILRRSKRDTTFVQMDKTPLQDKNLSWKAKGLLAYILSLPDDWQIYVSELQNHAKDGRDGTRAALNELINSKYIYRRKERSKVGKFEGYEYVVFETPQTANPFTANPFTANPFTENPPLLINKDTNNDNKNNDSTFLKNPENLENNAQTPQDPKTNSQEKEKKGSGQKKEKEEVVDEGLAVLQASAKLKQTILTYLSQNPTILTHIRGVARYKGEIETPLQTWVNHNSDNFKARQNPTSYFCKSFPNWLINHRSRNKGGGKRKTNPTSSSFDEYKNPTRDLYKATF